MPLNTVQQLIQGDQQTRLALLQVYRAGNWVEIPFESIKGTVGKGKAGKLDIAIPESKDDKYRAQIFEGERVRLYRGVLGAPLVRCFTGYCDMREPTDSPMGISRKITATDNFKELSDSILLSGALYDGVTPAVAATDIIRRCIDTQQFRPQDDAGNYLTDLSNPNTPNGNPVCYFPDLHNDDGSLFVLPQGLIASYTTAQTPNPTFELAAASAGYNYVAFEFPKRYMIASTTTIPGFTQATLSQTFPPARGTYVLDAYNGLAYFNSLDGSRTASFSASYYDSPYFNYDPGQSCGDIISKLFDNAGNRWKVDGFGKIISQFVDTVTAPKRILNRNQYLDNGIEINRDRRNVIVCLGWDGNCGGLLVSKCVLKDDITSPPPFGLGKRAYVIIQGKEWKTQYAVNVAAYYAALQIGRRGKIASITLLDDPTIQLDDAIAYESTVPEVGTGDFFYVEQTTFELSVTNGAVKATNNLSGTLLPGRGTIYLGPASAVNKYGALDYTSDVTPIVAIALRDHISQVQVGGTYYATFSISRGLDLTYQVMNVPIIESIDVYGSDGSHHVYENNIPRNANTQYSLPLPITDLTPGLLYVFKFWTKDAQGNIGIYRDFATALA